MWIVGCGWAYLGVSERLIGRRLVQTGHILDVALAGCGGRIAQKPKDRILDVVRVVGKEGRLHGG